MTTVKCVDYIERQAAIDAVQAILDFYEQRPDVNRHPSASLIELGVAEDEKWSAAANSVEKVINTLQHIPASDVVPVVRCKDCGYWSNDALCEMWRDKTTDDDFCSYGWRV